MLPVKHEIKKSNFFTCHIFQAVDEFFSKLEGQKLDVKTVQQVSYSLNSFLFINHVSIVLKSHLSSPARLIVSYCKGILHRLLDGTYNWG